MSLKVDQLIKVEDLWKNAFLSYCLFENLGILNFSAISKKK